MVEQDAERMQNEATAQATLSVEEIIEGSLGQMNHIQILQAILVSIPPLFDNQQTFISVFTDAQPAWHCTNSNHTICTSSYSICSLRKTDWAWNGNKHSTIISEWDLECASSFIKGLPVTSYFVGCLLGGFVLASLGDSSLGRKNLLFISCLTMSAAALASAFSPNIWLYSIFRFISGVGRVSITTCSFILLSERVGKKWRGQIVLLGFISLTFGMLSLTAIAFLTRACSWRALYLWTSIPAIICYAIVYFFLFDSPRWLFMQGRKTDAMAVLKSLGSLEPFSSTLPNIPIIKQVSPNNSNPFSSFKILVKKRWAILRLIVVMVLSFGVGMMHFGMCLGVGDFGGPSIYLRMVFNSLLFLLSSLIIFLFWIPRCNRKSSVLVFCTISGAASIISIVAGEHHKGIHLGLELIALFCACLVFNFLFMYIVELFPTCVRNTAASFSKQAVLFATIFLPVLVVSGRRNELLSHVVFGVAILICGLLVLTLPETRGKVLCDSMEEQEVRDKDGGCSC